VIGAAQALPSELRRVQVASFALGPRRDEEAWRRSRSQLEQALAKRPRAGARRVGLFGGVDPTGRRRTARRDLRDWTEIGTWTRRVLAAARKIDALGPPAPR
jgi:hypothetical protein